MKGSLTGKIVIDVTVPLQPPKVGTVQLPEGQSTLCAAQALLGEEIFVVSAFQSIAADLLQDPTGHRSLLLVSGNKKDARQKVIELAAEAVCAAGTRGPSR